MAKGKKLLTSCLWLNRAAKEVILDRSMSLFIFEIPLDSAKQIVKPGTS